MRSELTEANMDALNRSFEKMDMESRRSSARVGSDHQRVLASRHHDDRRRYDDYHINSRRYNNPRNRSTRDGPRRRRRMESSRLDDAYGFNEEDIYPRETSIRCSPRERQDIESGAMGRPSPNNFPHALGGRHRPRSRTTDPCLPLPELLAELDEAEGDEESGEEAMRRSPKGSIAYNQGREKRERAKLRIKQVKKEAYKHDPDKHDMDKVERIARYLSSRDERHCLAGGSSRSHRGPTPNGTRHYGRREYTAGLGGGHDPRHSYGGRSRNLPSSEFY